MNSDRKSPTRHDDQNTNSSKIREQNQNMGKKQSDIKPETSKHGAEMDPSKSAGPFDNKQRGQRHDRHDEKSKRI